MTNRFRAALAPCAALLSMLGAAPLDAKVTKQWDDGFVTHDEALVSASAKEVWLRLIRPAQWWNKAHTWTGDSANLRLTPQAGGCFCEKVPEDPDSEKITLEGSVEHMRVIHAFPERALRMRGGLGPLQSEPATGVLTVVLTETDKGTRVVWEYVVGGPMRYDIPVISKAVDAVMTTQLNALVEGLGRLDRPDKPDAQAQEPGDEGEAPAQEPPGKDLAQQTDEKVATSPDEKKKNDGEAQNAKPVDTPLDKSLSLEQAIDAMADENDNRPE